MFWASFGHVLGIIWTCVGHHPDMFRASSGHVWDAFLILLGVFTKILKNMFQFVVFCQTLEKKTKNQPKGNNSTPRADNPTRGDPGAASPRELHFRESAHWRKPLNTNALEGPTWHSIQEMF